MPVLPVRLFGDPVLTTPADEVMTFDAELRRRLSLTGPIRTGRRTA